MKRRDLLKMACVAPLAPALLLGQEKEELKSNWNFEIHDWDTEMKFSFDNSVMDRHGLLKHERYWVSIKSTSFYLRTNGTLSDEAGAEFGYFKTKEDAQKMIDKFVSRFPDRNILSTPRKTLNNPIDSDGAEILLCCQ